MIYSGKGTVLSPLAPHALGSASGPRTTVWRDRPLSHSFGPMLALVSLLLAAAPVQPVTGLAPATTATVRETLTRCSGGWRITGEGEPRLITPAQLVDHVEALRGPASALSEEQARDLYKIAHALLRPALEPPSWVSDKNSFLTCEARPAEALALMHYLAGDGPGDWRGAVNIYAWLGLAYQKGVGTPAHPQRARRFLLIYAMHSLLDSQSGWSDGIDNDLLRNIERAGLRAWLEKVSSLDRASGAARMILAEEALSRDPGRARSLLLYPDIQTLNRLLALEAEGRVSMARDGSDVAVWSRAWATLPLYQKWAARLVTSARLANGGSLPTSTTRPSTAAIRSHIAENKVRGRDGTDQPVPMRALVDPQGRALYVEACRLTPANGQPRGDLLGVLLDAARLYQLDQLPRLPAPRVAGKPAYGWVVLPAVHFRQEAPDAQLNITLSDLPPDHCLYSAFQVENETVSIPAPPLSPRPPS